MPRAAGRASRPRRGSWRTGRSGSGRAAGQRRWTDWGSRWERSSPSAPQPPWTPAEGPPWPCDGPALKSGFCEVSPERCPATRPRPNAERRVRWWRPRRRLQSRPGTRRSWTRSRSRQGPCPTAVAGDPVAVAGGPAAADRGPAAGGGPAAADGGPADDGRMAGCGRAADHRPRPHRGGARRPAAHGRRRWSPRDRCRHRDVLRRHARGNARDSPRPGLRKRAGTERRARNRQPTTVPGAQGSGDRSP